MESLLNDSAEQIHPFIPGISIAPLQVLYYSEAKMEEPVTVMDAIKGIMCKRNKTFSIRCSLKRGVAINRAVSVTIEDNRLADDDLHSRLKQIHSHTASQCREQIQNCNHEQVDTRIVAHVVYAPFNLAFWCIDNTMHYLQDSRVSETKTRLFLCILLTQMLQSSLLAHSVI